MSATHISKADFIKMLSTPMADERTELARRCFIFASLTSYYTGTVFEVESLDFNSSIAGGGRYDNLIGKFLKEQIPAVGFSIGFERIYSILMEKESYNTEKQKKVVLIYEEDQVADAIRYAEELRKTYKTALYIKPKKLGKFLNKLEEQGFDGFQVFGRDEEVRMFGEQ